MPAKKASVMALRSSGERASEVSLPVTSPEGIIRLLRICGVAATPEETEEAADVDDNFL